MRKDSTVPTCRGACPAREAEWDEASNLPDLPLAGPGAFENDAEFVAPPSAQPD